MLGEAVLLPLLSPSHPLRPLDALVLVLLSHTHDTWQGGAFDSLFPIRQGLASFGQTFICHSGWCYHYGCKAVIPGRAKVAELLILTFTSTLLAIRFLWGFFNF